MRIGRRLLFTLLLGALVCVASTASAANSSPDACRAGTKRAVIGGKVKCLKAGQACQARYQSAYKRVGLTCVNGRLAPPPTPPPPPAPPAQAGHYHGTTSQLETIDFDVNSDGTRVTAAKTGQINEGCTPPAHLFGGGLASGSASISSAGDFTIDFTYSGHVGDAPSTGHFTLTGHFNGATATGTLQDNVSFTDNGTAYSCGSGLQTWTASRTG